MSDAPAKPPRRRRSLVRRAAVRIAFIAAGVWVGLCAVLFFMQDQMLFPRHMVVRQRGEPTIAGVEVMRREIDGGESIAWFAPAHEPEPPAPLVVYCHGNAETIDQQAAIVAAYRRMGMAVLLPEYRGYGRADGAPSQVGIRADLVDFLGRTLKRVDVDPQRVVMHGRSLGAAVAVDLAAQHKPVALILDAPFRSVVAIAHGYGAPGFLVRNPYRTDRTLPELALPTLIFHGRADRIVPIAHGRTLAKLTPTATLHERPGGHNDPGDDAYWQTVRQFLVDRGIIRP